MSLCSPYALGATLYMPATRPDILDVVSGDRLPELRSLVVCLEDAVSPNDVQFALSNLERLLKNMHAQGGRSVQRPMLFVRPRDSKMAAILNDWPLIGLVDGFVVPKLTLRNLSAWESAVTNPSIVLMPTLETHDVFQPAAMAELAQALRGEFDQRIIALRMGGNDLMGCLGLRRSRTKTLYSGPMSYVISMLAGVMGAAGFSLTAPVFEQLSSPALLDEELELDIAHGLVGKTAIHPSQIAAIHSALAVRIDDLNSARCIVEESAPAVFKFNDAMCEPATHYKWAQNILERAKWYGVRQEATETGLGLAELMH